MHKDKNILTTEETEFIRALEQDPTGPGDAFVKDLEQKVERTFEVGTPSQSNFFRDLFMNTKNKKFFLGGASVLSVFLVAVIGYYTLSPFLSPQIDGDQLTLEEILARAVEKNSLRNSGNGGESLMASKAYAEGSLSADMSAPLGLPSPFGWEDYNYSSFSSIYTPGESFNTCPVMNYPSLPIETTSVNKYFWDEAGRYMGLNKVTDSEGNVISYSLNYDNVSYIYSGGDYAVKTVYEGNDLGVIPLSTDAVVSDDDVKEIYPEGSEETLIAQDMPEESATTPGESDDGVSSDVDPDKPLPIDEPDPSEVVEEPADPMDYIYQFFGENTVLVGQELVNGRNAYVVEWSYDMSCDQTGWEAMVGTSLVDGSPDADLTKVISRTWIDAESFLILKQEDYVNSPSKQNMVGRRVESTDNRKATNDEVRGEFVYDLDPSIEIRELTYKSYTSEEEYALAVEYAQENGLDLLFPTDQALLLNYLGGSFVYRVEGDDYYADRDFYGDGEVGDVLYEQMNPVWAVENQYVESIFSLNFATSDWSKSLSIEYYEKAGHDGLVEQFTGTEPDREESTTVTINGQNVTATKYTFSYESYIDEPMPGDPPGTEPDGSSGSYEGSGTVPSRMEDVEYSYLLLDLGEYTISIYNEGSITSFTSYDLSSSTAKATVEGLIDDLLERQANESDVDYPAVEEQVMLER